MRCVVAAMAASTTAVAETAMSSRWCSPTAKTSSPAASASFAAARISVMRCRALMAWPAGASGMRSPKV
jgi:hypothetical protein